MKEYFCENPKNALEMNSKKGSRKHFKTAQPSLFDILTDLISPEVIEQILNIPARTVYDWRARGNKRKRNRPPEDLFSEFNGRIFVRKVALIRWYFLQNPHLMGI